MKNFVSAALVSIGFISPSAAIAQSKPKLVVGIVVDQMRTTTCINTWKITETMDFVSS